MYLITAIYGSHKDLEYKYPAIYKHLSLFKIQLQQRGQCRYTSNGKPNTSALYPGQHHWLELDNNPSQEYTDDFSKQKIVYAETMRVHKFKKIKTFPRFTLVDEGYFLDKTCFMITGKNLKYILAILNSNLTRYIISKNVAVMDTGGFLMQKIYIEQFPIPTVSKKEMIDLINIIDKIIVAKQDYSDTSTLEYSIDCIVYNLFEFTKEEMAFIESQCSQ